MGVRTGAGWAAAELDDLGEGWGFRKLRRELGVEAFGVNVIVLPPGQETRRHYHDRQEELYFVHRGRIRFSVGDDELELGEGGSIRIDAPVVRQLVNASDSEPAVYLCVGGAGGYVGRDGRLPDE